MSLKARPDLLAWGHFPDLGDQICEGTTDAAHGRQRKLGDGTQHRDAAHGYNERLLHARAEAEIVLEDAWSESPGVPA